MLSKQRFGHEKRGSRLWAPWLLAITLAMVVGAWWPAGAFAEGETGATAVEVTGAWARPGDEGANSAVYLHLRNPGSETVTIIEARADVADDIELHETVLEMVSGPGGTPQQLMKMEHIHHIEVAPGENVVLRPGGLHIMLLGLRRDLAVGDSFTLTLVVTSGEEEPVEVPVHVQVGQP